MSKHDIYARFKSIEGDGLASHSLSLSDYTNLADTLSDVLSEGRGQTYIKAVADWCVRNGLMVSQTIAGIRLQ
jgi:hypothetical protein